MLKIEWEEKHSYIIGEKIINRTQGAVVIYIDPYNILYHLQKSWNSFRVCLASMYLLKQDVSLRFFWKLHQYVRDRAAQTGNCYFLLPLMFFWNCLKSPVMRSTLRVLLNLPTYVPSDLFSGDEQSALWFYQTFCWRGE